MTPPTPEEYAQDLERSYAGFCRALSYLEPEERSRSCLAGDWTPAALVAHVAFWDRFQRERMEAALVGTWADRIPWPEEDNDVRAVQAGELDWDEVLAEADRARRQLVDFARSVTPRQIETVYPEGGKERPVLQILLAHMARHVRDHTQDLYAYCASLERWGKAGFRRFYRVQHDNLLDAISGLDEDSCTTVPAAERWTLRDVLAHVLAWDEYAEQVVRSWPDVPLARLGGWTGDDIETVNRRLWEERREMGMIELLDGLATTHRRILRHYDDRSEEELAGSAEYGWGHSDSLLGFLFGMSVHTAEHAAAMWEARARVIFGWLLVDGVTPS